MKFYIGCNNYGMLVASQSCPSYAPAPVADSVTFVEILEDEYRKVSSSVGKNEYFYQGGVFRKAPQKPSENHSWDWALLSWVVDEQSVANNARAKRDSLLAQSDWTQLPDVPLATKEAWANYRQALRDITNRPGFPLDIVWPTPPA